MFERISILLLASVLPTLPGCYEPPLHASEALPYQTCQVQAGESEICSDGETSCQLAPTLEGPGICSMECVDNTDCPPHERLYVSCERFARVGSMCVLRCDPDADVDSCPRGTECEEAERAGGLQLGICLPQ